MCYNVCAQGACNNIAQFPRSACDINMNGKELKFSEGVTFRSSLLLLNAIITFTQMINIFL